jgi:hypothetical protein
LAFKKFFGWCHRGLTKLRLPLFETAGMLVLAESLDDILANR